MTRRGASLTSALPVAIVACVVVFAQSGQPGPTSTMPATARPGEVAGKTSPASSSSAASGDKKADSTKGTAVIRGRIVLASGRPARRASIQLTSSGPAHATAADDDGHYEFTDLPADTYRLSAGRPGYLVLEYGQEHAFERGDPIELADGETRTKVDITLVPSGAVSGRIVDENGDPIEDVAVRLLQILYFANRRQLIELPQAGGRATDDRGSYRIYGVPPGDYLVRASVTDRLPGVSQAGRPIENASADIPGYAPTYFPGTIDPGDAQLVHVDMSQDVQGIDFSLTAAGTARISGRATDARNQPVGVLLARSQRSAGFLEPPLRALATPDGGFRFDNVAPGEYVLQTYVSRRNESEEPNFATTRVAVEGKDISDIVLQGTNGSTVNGRVIFEGTAPDTNPPTALVQVTAWPVDFERSPMLQNDIARTHIAADGGFELRGLQGPRRIRLLQAPRGWQLKSVRASGLDVTDDVLSFGLPRESLSDVQVILTTIGPTLTGQALDDRGRAARDYVVVAFSTDPDRWYQRSRFMATSKARQDGTFSITGLAHGNYYVAAVTSLMNPEGWGEWQDPEFLRKLIPSAVKATLADGQSVAVALPLAR